MKNPSSWNVNKQWFEGDINIGNYNYGVTFNITRLRWLPTSGPLGRQGLRAVSLLGLSITPSDSSISALPYLRASSQCRLGLPMSRGRTAPRDASRQPGAACFCRSFAASRAPGWASRSSPTPPGLTYA